MSHSVPVCQFICIKTTDLCGSEQVTDPWYAHTFFNLKCLSGLKKFISLTCSFYYLTSIKTISTEVILQISFLYLNTPSILTCTTSLLLLI